MMIFLGIQVHLLGLGLGNIAGKDADDGRAFGMDNEHEPGGFFKIVGEELLDHMDDKFHGRVIVVQQDDLEHGWPGELWLGGCCCQSTAGIITRWIVIVCTDDNGRKRVKCRSANQTILLQALKSMRSVRIVQPTHTLDCSGTRTNLTLQLHWMNSQSLLGGQDSRARVAIGKVKWFNNAKGYGFVVADDFKDDLFAHYSSIVMDGYKTLKAGQDVAFDIIDGPKGKHAVNIRPTEGTVHVHMPEHDVDTNGIEAEPQAIRQQG